MDRDLPEQAEERGVQGWGYTWVSRDLQPHTHTHGITIPSTPGLCSLREAETSAFLHNALGEKNTHGHSPPFLPANEQQKWLQHQETTSDFSLFPSWELSCPSFWNSPAPRSRRRLCLRAALLSVEACRRGVLGNSSLPE